MYKRLLIITIVAVYFLILVGSTVRSTGSGMGCPDWPKCFGQYIPPTSSDELPINYKELYTQAREKKNFRLEKFFKVLSIEDVLYNRKAGHTTYSDVEYDFTKAWIEYLNRLTGVVVGFLVLACFIFSFTYLKRDLSIVFYSFLSLVLLLAEAFLGSVVVSTQLFPELISLHMLLALVLLFILMLMYMKLNTPLNVGGVVPRVVFIVSIVSIFMSCAQMFLGIEVREMVDYLHNEVGIYNGVINVLDKSFYIHRSFSILVLITNIWMVFVLMRYGLNNRWSRWLLPIVFASIFTGVTLGYFDLPRVSQPFHLLLGSLLIGMQFLSLLYIKFAQSE